MQQPTLATDHGLTTQLMVGMEIHVELATRTKMWTSAPNVAHPDFHDADPNTLLDPVVFGAPGTLPVMNREAVDMSIKVGLALGCEIARHAKWDRKSYYYPDLPKGYQISQYDQPICGVGHLDIPDPEDETQSVRIGITRAHLEEDAGKLMHELPGGGFCDGSLVDLNRAGTPLLEIVTEPDIQTPDQAVAFGQALRDICRYLGVTEGVMQKGHMRFEPNINVIITNEKGEVFKTPVVEIKNLNSFAAVHGAITHEYERQIEEWLETGRVMGDREKSTRGWDDAKLVTTMQRTKEDADEYRYFPDPDLVAVTVTEAQIDALTAAVPELPFAKAARYQAELGLSAQQTEQLMTEPAVAGYFEDVLAAGGDAKKAAAFLLNTAAKRANEQGVLLSATGATPAQVSEILQLSAEDKINKQSAEKLFALCCESVDAASAAALAEEHNLIQQSDTGALDGWIDQVLTDPKSAKAIEDIKAGKDKAVGMLMGGIMKLSKGQANPKLVRDRILEKVRG